MNDSYDFVHVGPTDFTLNSNIRNVCYAFLVPVLGVHNIYEYPLSTKQTR